MNRNSLLGVALVSFAALGAGCTAGAPKRSAPAAAPRATDDVATCSTSKACGWAWAAARNWVLAYCPTGIATFTDELIETHPPVYGSVAIACRVTRSSIGGKRFQLKLVTTCGSFGHCVPSQEVANESFVRAVMSSARMGQ